MQHNRPGPRRSSNSVSFVLKRCIFLEITMQPACIWIAIDWSTATRRIKPLLQWRSSWAGSTIRHGLILIKAARARKFMVCGTSSPMSLTWQCSSHVNSSEGFYVRPLNPFVSVFQEVIVGYARLMVHLELGRSNAGRLRVAADIAQRFRAEVVGIAACRPMNMTFSDGYVPAEIIDQDRERIEKETTEAETEFRSSLQGRVTKVEWRSVVTFSSLSDYITCEARSADLVVTGVTPGRFLDNSRTVNLGDLIMQLGRPILMVPPAPDILKLDRVVVGWKDTREARRAVSDALPVLKAAAQVTVVEIAGEDELAAARSHVEDVVDWLERHGVRAKALTLTSTGNDSTQLNAIAHERGANLIVAGAYGHSRLREWALGGVTRALLGSASRCSLLSH